MKTPQLTIDILLSGADRLDAVFDGFDVPQYTVTAKEGGVLALETVLRGTKNVKQFPVGAVYLGRSSECAIHIPPACPESIRVSRRQGVFTYADGWHYEPLAKDNPTYFGDHPLLPGSVARIAKETILGIGPKQRDPMKYAVTLKLGVQ